MNRMVQAVSGLLLVFLIVVLAWNFLGAVSLAETDETYVGAVRSGTLAGQRVGAGGVEAIRQLVETETRPSFDPIRILREQLWYNAITDGYEFQVWIEPNKFDSRREQYAIYQKDKMLFLRIEYRRRNRVLVAAFTPQDVEDAIKPFVIVE